MGTSETLRSVIDTGRTTKRLDELSTARVIGKVAEQVHAAHQKAGPGKAIGPITPSSIAIAASGAVSFEVGASALGYSAPEQIAGGAGDRRSDVFSLGAVMWEALTHQRLFDAMNDAAVKVAIQERPITSPAELNANIPAELSAICMRALARNAADRYQSAKVMAVEIEEFLNEAGYPDSDEQIATYLAGVAKTPKPKAHELPPPTPIAAPIVAQPSPPALPLPVPSVPKLPTQPPANASSTAAGMSPLSFLKSPTQQPPSTTSTPSSGSPLASALATPPPVAPTVAPPSPPVVPAAVAPPSPPVVPAAVATPSPPVVPVAAAPAPTPAAAPSPPQVPLPPVLPASAKATINGTAPGPTSAVEAAPQPVNGTDSGPNPAAVVALPPIPGSGGVPHRESRDVLAGWGWKTDSHNAIGDESDYEMPTSGNRSLIYMIGGGLVLALVVTVIAVGFGGSKSKKKELAPAAATKEGSADVAMTAPPPPPPSPAGSAAPEGSAGSAAADMAQPGSGSDQAAPGSAAAPTGSGSNQVAAAPTAGSDVAKVETKPEPAKVETKPEPAKVETKPEPAKVETPKPDKLAKIDTPKKPEPLKADKPKVEPTKKPDAIKKPEPTKPKVEPTKKFDAAKVAKTDPAKSKPGEVKPDVETTYRIGLQQFARGDTTGALASLRTALAANPSYAPTWRGLGLVFEKLGEKEQARAAFKRYLQLAPSAGDAESIRGRLERLGS